MNENALKLNKPRLFLAKILFLWVLAFFICCLLPHPISQAASKKVEQTKVSKTVDDFIQTSKSYNKKKINKYLVDKNWDYIKSKKLQRMIKRASSETLTYKIKKVKIKGNKATAVIRVTHYSSYNRCVEEMKKYIVDSALYNKKIKNLNPWIGELSWTSTLDLDDIQNGDTTMLFSYNIKIPLVKTHGKWKIERMTPSLLSIIDTGIAEFIHDFEKDPMMIFKF